VAICGEVGSGKSTLLATILGEVPNTKGTVSFYFFSTHIAFFFFYRKNQFNTITTLYFLNGYTIMSYHINLAYYSEVYESYL